MANSPEVEAFWARFVGTLPEGSPRPASYQVWYFGSSEAMAAELAALVLEGKKTATASLSWSFEDEREPWPEAGGYSLITDFGGKPLFIIQTTRTYIVPFNQVDEEQAYLEGEDDRSLTSWREGHWRFFTAECSQMGREPSEEMPVVCERFRLVYAEQP